MRLRKLPEIHIEGYKEQSIKIGPKKYLEPKFVYIPLGFPNGLKQVKSDGEHVKLGEVIIKNEGRFPYPILSPVSGTIKGVVKKWHSSNKMIPMLEIENDFNEEMVDDFKGLHPNKMTREELIDVMERSGLVGMGGAGFPAYLKYKTQTKVDMVIINLAECEPFITCDYTCVLYNAEKFISGFRYLLKAADCNKGYIAIKDKAINKKVIDYIKPLLDENMEIKLLKDVYPAGWERYTVEKVSGRTYDKLPIEAGVIVSNASTCFSFARTLEDGIPPSEKYVTITGDAIKKPGNVLAKIGTPIEELVPLFGGLKDGITSENTSVIAGGPMTGKSIHFAEFTVTHTLGAAIFLIDRKSRAKQCECLGCGRCADYCPSFLSPFRIKQELKAGNMDELKLLAVTKCIQCGMCSFVCPSRLELTETVGKAKELVMKLGR